jgi:tripartite-type tricarboxylate transporter receptor subunit TctC
MRKKGALSRTYREETEMRLTILLRVMFLLMAVLLAPISQAQSLAAKPITLVVPFQAGSPTDLVARALGDGLSQSLGTPVIVDNRPGASQTVAGALVARVPADGHTLFLANLPAVVAPSVQAKLPYTGIREFAAIAHLADITVMLALAPDVPATNLKEFIELLRAEPTRYPFFSTGVGSPIHMLTEMLNMRAGVRTVHVPYKGVPTILPDLMAGRVAYGFLQVGAMEHVRTGKIKGLALVGRSRDPLYPELPTMAEAGMPDFTNTVAYVLVAPRGTPPGIVATLNAATNRIIAAEQFHRKLAGIGLQFPGPKTPAEAAVFIQAEEARWEKLLKIANIKLE